MSSTVTRSLLAKEIYKQTGISAAESSDLVDEILEEMILALENDGILKISSFGSFRVNQKSERIGRNPKTQEEAIISARKVVTFYASNILKDTMNSK